MISHLQGRRSNPGAVAPARKVLLQLNTWGGRLCRAPILPVGFVPLHRALQFAFVVLLLAGSPALLHAQAPVQTAAEVNDRIGRLALTALAPRPHYVIGSGDLLRVDVFDVENLSREVRVADSGHVSLPLLPVKIRAAGLTAIQLEEKIAELLQSNGLVSSPHVTVFIKEHLNQPITVLGAVNKPAVIPSVRRPSLLEALTAAGGLSPEAGHSVTITRPASPPPSGANEAAAPSARAAGTLTISLKDLLESGDPRFNIFLSAGDVVTVPRAGVIYVVGAVNRPGGFLLSSDREQMSALKAVALAQGTMSTAKLSRALIIRKDAATGQEIEIPVNLKKILARKTADVPLRSDDILFVPDSTGKKLLRRAAEAGLAITSGLLIFRR